ncbi:MULTISPECIES: nuclear transport factor 2 family protein [Streptomyces]|uniref:Nuclear transport factor 2 family protein n=1 Tax=Streptomyces nondiastaticus TaxID=3154512 RepID=A0ABW6U5V1_9ACTN|nr:nuclear transport factor 2 family protein [Streptomyces sp. VNUA116]WKU48670.1 nuclear transport factor 2 family protein [Streptomyces sp. VNUA116]
MLTDNRKLIEGAYRAFAIGDIPAVLQAFAEEITWHVPGRSPLSGDYRGHREIVEFFGRVMELSEGSFRIRVDDVLTDTSRVVVLCTVSAERSGRAPWSSPEVHVWDIAAGKAVAFREFQGDQQAEDAFWS